MGTDLTLTEKSLFLLMLLLASSTEQYILTALKHQTQANSVSIAVMHKMAKCQQRIECATNTQEAGGVNTEITTADKYMHLDRKKMCLCVANCL